MLDTRTIELRLPVGLDLEDLDVETIDPELMRSILRTVFHCCEEDRNDADALLAGLRTSGWTVRQGLTWVACAERGDYTARVTAPTRCEAVARLREYVMLHEAEGTP